MKPLISIVVSLLFFSALQAQNITFELLKPPCKDDGILVAHFPTSSPPTNLSWNYNGNYITKSNITETSDTIYDFSGGAASIYVYGTNGNTNYGSYFSNLPFKIEINTTINTCPTPSLVEVTTTGGTAPFSYAWYKNINGVQTLVGNTNPLNVTTGEYGVVITDNAGCEVNNLSSKQDSTYIYINVPVGYTYDIITTEANCTNGTASITNITGGNAPFTFLWSNGATSQNLQNLSTGNYPVTITDGDGCSTIQYEVYIQQSIGIEVPVSTTPALCSNNDGGAIAFGSGGTAPYTYKWSTGSTLQSINNLASGYYTVDAIDVNGCKGSGYAYINSNSPVYVSILTNTPSSCTSPTGSAEISINGGTAPYNVIWNTFPPQTGTILSNVPAGSYGFTVKDNLGCVRTGNVVISPESIINANLGIIPANCAAATGSLSTTVTGGNLPYSYLWSNGNTQPSISNLPSSYYTVTISDALGCTSIKSAFVPKNSPLSVGFITIPASCIFNSDGEITANGLNGTPPYNYSWSNGMQTATVTGLKQGLYSVAINDANGCEITDYVVLNYDVNENNCYCKIEGTVYHDLNEDCIQDTGEPGIVNVQVHCKGVGYTYTNSVGEYSFIVPTGTYEISESIKSYSPLSGCQNNKILINTVSGSGCIKKINFANKLNPINDVRISLWNDNFAVPGFTYKQNMIITNAGTISENNIISSYKTDNQIGVPSFNPNFLNQLVSPGYYVNGPNVTLNPGNSESVKVEYLVPTNIPINTDLYFTDSTHYQLPMSSWVNDFTPWNNVNQLHTNVVGSFDPNFIQVYPQGSTEKGFIGTKDSVLEYMVHFQNYGNYYATNVRVEVQLDPNLTRESVQPIFSSSPSSVLLNENGHLIYSFNNINLYPKNWNEELSKGFFTFSVKQNPGLSPGTEISNLADIYFDFNEPVRTNNTINTIEKGASTNPEPGVDLVQKIYPNPANNSFYLLLSDLPEGAIEIRMSDLFGRLIKSEVVNNNSITVEMSTETISSGTYFINVISGNSTSKTYKLMLIKD